MINFNDFQKLEIKIGEIKSAEAIPETDKLIKFIIDIGEKEIQVISGIKEHYPNPEMLTGKQVPVLVNLEPRVIKGFESQGMVLYVVGEGENFTTLEPGKKIANGTIVK